MGNNTGTAGKNYDVVIVGASIVATYLARRLAEKGHKVLIVDKLDRENLGGWKNSGHNIDKTVFQRLPIRPPDEEELGAQVDYAHYNSPGAKFDFYLPMYNVKLGVFTQRMLDEAVESGAEFRDQASSEEAIVENGAVVGVKLKTPDGVVDVRAKIVVDISGIDSVVRNKLPDSLGFEKGMTPFDYLNVYSEDREVGMENWPAPFVYRAKYQGWSGSRRPGVVGIGLGRFASTGEDPRAIHPEFAKEALSVEGKTIFKTYCRVPVRHPLHRLVGPGVMILGDAGYQGKPLNGEGLTVMLDAAEMAFKAADAALKKGDCSERALWPYAVEWHRSIGANFSPLHRMRYEILQTSKADQEFLIGLGIYGPKEMSAVMHEGQVKMSLGSALNLVGVVWRGRSKLGLLGKLASSSVDGMKLKKLHRAYPENPADLPDWIKRVEALYKHP